jgi:hypothetical protein
MWISREEVLDAFKRKDLPREELFVFLRDLFGIVKTVSVLRNFVFPLELCEKCRGADFPMATRTSTIGTNALIPLMSPIFSHEIPASVAPTSRDAPVCPLCPETLALGNSQRPMCALATRECRAMHGRSQKGCCLIAML